MEEAAEVRAEASCPDDAEIDLTVWSWAGESERSILARNVLRRFAVKWWKHYHTRKAINWLKSKPPSDETKFDKQAVDDCLIRINACKYFKWVRGSRIFYWQLPKEWQSEFRDGIKIWQLPNTALPEGHMRSIPSEAREHELSAREKVFRMRFTRYLELGTVKLVIPNLRYPRPMMLGWSGTLRRMATTAFCGLRPLFWAIFAIWRKLRLSGLPCRLVVT